MLNDRPDEFDPYQDLKKKKPFLKILGALKTSTEK